MYVLCTVGAISEACLCDAGSGGKHHSVVVTRDGRSLAFGSNLMGQCGTGALKSKDKVEGAQAALWQLVGLGVCPQPCSDIGWAPTIPASHVLLTLHLTPLSVGCQLLAAQGEQLASVVGRRQPRHQAVRHRPTLPPKCCRHWCTWPRLLAAWVDSPVTLRATNWW